MSPWQPRAWVRLAFRRPLSVPTAHDNTFTTTAIHRIPKCIWNSAWMEHASSSPHTYQRVASTIRTFHFSYGIVVVAVVVHSALMIVYVGIVFYRATSSFGDTPGWPNTKFISIPVAHEVASHDLCYCRKVESKEKKIVIEFYSCLVFERRKKLIKF